MQNNPYTLIAPLVQGAFFVTAGLWPVLHLRSFEAVTGPKVDGWLVKTIGGLIAVVGATLVVGSRERRPSPALKVLGLGSAATLALADVLYVSKGRISRVYLADTAVQAAILGLWLWEHRPRMGTFLGLPDDGAKILGGGDSERLAKSRTERC